MIQRNLFKMFNHIDMLPVSDKDFTHQAVYGFGEHYELSVVHGGSIEGYEICLFHNGMETPFVGITDKITRDRLDESEVKLIMLKLRTITGHRPIQI